MYKSNYLFFLLIFTFCGKFSFSQPNSSPEVERFNTSHYLAGPSGFQLSQGSGMYKNTMLSFNSFHYGLTDHISLSGGVDMLGLINAFSEPASFGGIFGGIKVGTALGEQVHIAGGVQLGFNGYTKRATEDSEGNLVVLGSGVPVSPYTVLTFGTPAQNLSIHAVYPYISGESYRGPAASISYMKRINQKLTFLTENWYIPANSSNMPFSNFGNSTRIVNGNGISNYNQFIVSVALKIHNNRSSFDLGLLAYAESFNERFTVIRNGVENEVTRSSEGLDFLPFPLPIFGYTYRF